MDYFGGLRVMEQRQSHRVAAPLCVGAVEVKKVWEFNVLLEWESPQDDSNSEGTGSAV